MSGGPVRIALDLQALQVDGFADRGIGRYLAGFSRSMAGSGRLAAALLAPELPPPSGLPQELLAADLVAWDCAETMRRVLAEGSPVAHHSGAPFLHVSPGDPPCLVRPPHWSLAGVPRVATLYDLIPLRAPRHYLPSPAAEQRYRERARWVAGADLVLAISEHTRREAVELLGCDPERVVTVGAGVSSYFSPPDGTDEQLWRHRFGSLLGRTFLLTVGGSDARKGTERAVAALAALVRRGHDLDLLVVGDLTEAWQSRLAELAAACGVGPRVVLGGPVSDELLRAAYRRAAASVMPSLAEGAGLPVLESAACGTPALASSTTALAETAATHLATFDPRCTDSVADAVERLLADGARRDAVLDAQRALAASATWEAVARRAGAALDRLGEQLPASAWTFVAPPRRLALVGGLPPAGGIGEYNARLLGGLAGRVDVGRVDVDIVATSGGEAVLPAGVRRLSGASFGVDARPSSYDWVVYTLGNSAGHLRTVELALRHPGWLWLHETRLPAVAVSALGGADDRSFEAAMARLLGRAYPGRAPLGAARRAGRDQLALAAAGVGLLAPLSERCRGFLVSSELARRTLELDLAPLATHPPVHVLPPACPPVRARSAAEPTTVPLVVALGVVSMSKRPDLLVDAAALAGCRLAFLGPCPPVLRRTIEDRAALRGVAGRVEVLGAVAPELWWAWMDRAALAVQLRDSPGAETSASVLDALAGGLPVLTNVATAAELPAGTVSLLAGLDPELVGGRVAELLASPGELTRLSRAGQAFASANGFEELAAALLGVLSGEVA